MTYLVGQKRGHSRHFVSSPGVCFDPWVLRHQQCYQNAHHVALVGPISHKCQRLWRARGSTIQGSHLFLLFFWDAAECHTEASTAGDVWQVKVVLQPLVPLGVRRLHSVRVSNGTQRLRPMVDTRLYVDLHRHKGIRFFMLFYFAGCIS